MDKDFRFVSSAKRAPKCIYTASSIPLELLLVRCISPAVLNQNLMFNPGRRFHQHPVRIGHLQAIILPHDPSQLYQTFLRSLRHYATAFFTHFVRCLRDLSGLPRSAGGHPPARQFFTVSRRVA